MRSTTICHHSKSNAICRAIQYTPNWVIVSNWEIQNLLHMNAIGRGCVNLRRVLTSNFGWLIDSICSGNTPANICAIFISSLLLGEYNEHQKRVWPFLRSSGTWQFHDEITHSKRFVGFELLFRKKINHKIKATQKEHSHVKLKAPHSIGAVECVYEVRREASNETIQGQRLKSTVKSPAE